MPALLLIPVVILGIGLLRERSIERKERERQRIVYQVPFDFGAGKRP